MSKTGETIEITMVEDAECMNGYRICADGDGIPASIYEVALWKMYVAALSRIDKQKKIIDGLIGQLSKRETVDDT